MDKQNKDKLVRRFKSFVWRLGAVIAVASANFLAENLGLFGLSTQVQIVLGLILGEVTKFLNSKVN